MHLVAELRLIKTNYQNFSYKTNLNSVINKIYNQTFY